MDQQQDTLKGNDKAQYVRMQEGHSLLLHIMLICVGVGFFTIPYYTLSKNHYWHLWTSANRKK